MSNPNKRPTDKQVRNSLPYRYRNDVYHHEKYMSEQELWKTLNIQYVYDKYNVDTVPARIVYFFDAEDPAYMNPK